MQTAGVISFKQWMKGFENRTFERLSVLEHSEDVIDNVSENDHIICPICGQDACQLDDDEHELDEE